MDGPPIQHTTAADGTRIAYVRYPGESPPFLAVNTPGAPALTTRLILPAYGGFYPRFLRERAGLYFDWRGTGDSGPFDAPLRIDDLIADLDAVTAVAGEPVDANFVGRACFAGCLHAADHPERYRSIRLTGPALRPGENWQGLHNRPGWDRDYHEHLRGRARSYFDVSPAEATRIAVQWEHGVPKASWAAYLDAEQGVDLTEVLPRIEHPAWVMATNPMDYEIASSVAALLPNAEFSTHEPQSTRPELGDIDRERWDRHLGTRLGESVSRPLSGQSSPTLDDLTPRQRETLEHIAMGATNAEIAEAMTLSERTVEHHVAEVFARLGVHNRVLAANWARDHGIGG